MRIGRVVVALATLLLATACTRVTDGTARPAPGMAPRPLTGQAVEQVLLDKAELSKMFREGFELEPRSRPRFGGPDQLFGSDTAPECIGVVLELQKSAYRSGDVKVIGQKDWRITGGPEHTVIAVEEGVAALATPGDANALFAAFSHQWKGCDGKTVTQSIVRGSLELSYQISDVRVADTVLLATVRSGGGMFGVTLTDVRALGVRVNCLVEAKVTVFDDYPGDPQTSALGVARAMMDKVNSLS